MNGVFRGLVCVAVMLAASGPAWAAPGDLLFEYRSELGTLPEDQGWHLEAESAGSDCPLNETAPTCDFFGAIDADPCDGLSDNSGSVRNPPVGACTGGLGLTSAGGNFTGIEPVGGGTNHNAPAPAFGGYIHNYVWATQWPYGGVETYSEWMEFDDDGASLKHFGTLAQHLPQGATPQGAGSFPGAPPHQVLRLVGGDGNGIANSLPFIASWNNQDGKLLLDQTYVPSGVQGTETVVFRGALGVQQEGESPHAFLLVRAYDPVGAKTVYFEFTWFMPRTFGGGVPVCDAQPNPTADCGKFGIVNLQNGTSAQQCAGADGSTFDTPLLDGSGGGPNLGRVLPKTFFTFRAICDPSTNGGTATLWINEGTPEQATGSVSNTTYGPDFKWGCKNGIGGNDRRMALFGLRHEDDTTIWVDHVELYEGAVSPAPCAQFNPVFDQAGGGIMGDQPDGSVDQQDLSVFEGCATGPTPAAGVFDGLSDDCQCLDVTGDAAIDQRDFGFFQRCASGTGFPADPACDDN